MKNFLLSVLLLFSITAFSQVPQLNYAVPDIAAMKAYTGSANAVYVVATNAHYVICSPCTADEATVYAGAAGKKWKRVTPLTLAELIADATHRIVTDAEKTTWNAKQAALVSGTNIKTVNSSPILGSGDLTVQAPLVSGTNIKTINGNPILGSGNLTIASGASVPSVTGQANKLLSNDGTDAQWVYGTEYNILNHGCVGDSSTNNTTALQALIDLVPAYSTIYIPNGKFLITTVNVTKPLRFKSSVAPQFTYGGFSIASQIIGTSKNAKVFNVTSDYVVFEKMSIAIYDTAGQNAGALIYFEKGIGAKVEGCYLSGGYDDINIENGYSWQVTGNTITAMARYGIYARDLAIPDEGDAVISFNWIYPKRRNAHSLIRQESGGGIKVIGNKFNNSKLADGGPWHQDFCYSAKFFTGMTVLAIFTSNSFENFKVSAIKIEPNSNFGGMVVVTGNQFSAYNNNTLYLDFSHGSFPTVVVTGNSAAGGTGCQFINYSAVAGGLTIAGNAINDFIGGGGETPIYLHTDKNGVVKFKVTESAGIEVPTVGGGGDVTLTGTQTLTNKTISGSSNTITNVSASNLSAGTVPAARMGSGTADNTTILYGDNVWRTAPAGGSGGDMLANLVSSEVSITGATTLTSGAFGKMHLCSGTSADYTVDLPAASGNAGKIIGFRMSHALTKLVTLDANSSEVIDGATNRILWKDEVAILLCDGTGWTKIAGKSIPMVCIAAPSADGSAIGAGQEMPAALNTAISDAAGMLNTGNNRVYIRRPGNYLVTPIIRFESLPGAVNRLISYVQINGTLDFQHQGEIGGVSGSIPFVSIPSVATYAAGDYLKLYGYHGSVSNLNIRGNGTTENSSLSVEEKLSW